VTWAVEITNQEGKTVALYDILTLVERRGESRVQA
jgi:oxepin-CoA hydrolase/3-oxo-5,6-dehydrosuberyl-CoA semialdehyde dehydrogenase